MRSFMGRDILSLKNFGREEFYRVFEVADELLPFARDRRNTDLLKDKTLVKVELDEEDKVIFQNQQFEICFFLDHEFYAEDEAGYTPFNWVWDLSNVEEGEHVLTVNLSSFKDQIGIKSQKVRVVK